MSMTSPPLPELEIAHVLFMDLVGYSLLSLDEQAEVREKLRLIVLATEPFQRAAAQGELICLPSGDGMALVFLRNPVAPVQCALEIAAALKRHPELPLRMGIHSGPVRLVEEINTIKGVAGGGVNLAQRVMDCGDAGHILLSSATAEVLAQLRDWAGYLHELGECEVKHGVRLRLFNLYTGELGNREPPVKVAAGATTALPQKPAVPASDPAAVTSPEAADRVALLYKRNAQPDEQLLQLLETQLSAQGYQVFVDRHLAIGEEWVRAIEGKVRAADAVIPLVSAASIQSEMFTYELQTAHQAAQRQGKPRLLPVRLNYAGPLPDPITPILGPLHYTLWESPADNERLVADVLHALRHPPVPRVAVPPGKLESAGGTVPLDSQFYVIRSTDEEFRTAMERQDGLILVKGARQMGKTSLLARGLQQAREAGARTIWTDFQMLDAADLQSMDRFFRALAEWIADQLELEVLPDQAWKAHLGASVNFARYLRREVLGRVTAPLVWGLDEVDRLFDCEFGSQVFGMFRAWYNERQVDPTAPWSRLTVAMAYATEAHLFITDVNQSPFNVGTRLTLQDFSLAQVEDLNRRHGSPLRDAAESARFYQLVSGHPGLVRRGLLEMATHDMDISALEAQADRDEGIFGDHLRRILVLLLKDPELREVVRGVVRGEPCSTAESFYRLRTAGLMSGDSAHDARLRCQLYATYLQRHLR